MISSIELFSGAGGLALGLHQAGFDNRALLERDKDSCDTVMANVLYNPLGIQNWNVAQTDVRLVKYSDYGSGIRFVTGGPPCQPFSLGGRHEANNDERDMFPEAVRAVREIQPEGFIFENVKGILSMKDGANHSVMKRIVKKFKNIENDFGYNVSYQTLDAVNFGVPQSRERVFIVGIRNDLKIKWIFPEGNDSKLSIRSAISDLTSLKQGEEKTEYKKEPSNDYQKLMRFDSETLTFHRAALHDKKINMVIKNIKQGEGRFDFNQLIDEGVIDEEYRLTSGYKNTYGRLIGKNPSTTITHNMSTPSSLRCIHYSQNRALTPREGARIQSFPDNFQFYGNLSEVKSQIGNAVPPLLAIELYKQAKKVLKGENKIAKHKR
jgi:DNA (cytosine-5)-methyltransferase 1